MHLYYIPLYILFGLLHSVVAGLGMSTSLTSGLYLSSRDGFPVAYDSSGPEGDFPYLVRVTSVSVT